MSIPFLLFFALASIIGYSLIRKIFIVGYFYLFDGADLRSPYFISEGILILVFLISMFDTMSGLISLPNFYIIRSFVFYSLFPTLLYLNVHSRCFNYPALKIGYGVKMIAILGSTILYVITFILSFYYYTSFGQELYSEIASYILPLREDKAFKELYIVINGSFMELDWLYFSVNITQASFLYIFDRIENRSKKTLYLGKLLIVYSCVLLGLSLLDIRDYDTIYTKIFYITGFLSIIFCLVNVVRKEFTSIVRRATSLNVLIQPTLDTINFLAKRLKHNKWTEADTVELKKLALLCNRDKQIYIYISSMMTLNTTKRQVLRMIVNEKLKL